MTKLSKRHIDLDATTGLTGSDIPAALGSTNSIADALAEAGAGVVPARTRVTSNVGHTLATENILEDAGAVLATEGKEILSATIAPVSAQSTIRVEADFFVGTNSTSAVAAVIVEGAPTLVRRVCLANSVGSVHFVVEVPSTGAPMAVSLRVGRGTDSGTVYVNRVGASQMFEAENNISSLTLTELL